MKPPSKDDTDTAPQGKVFLVGFNKCGTTSFHSLFQDSGYASVHWDGGLLAQRIQENYKAGRALLSGYEQFTVFSDMEYLSSSIWIAAYLTYYKMLDVQYPESRFILNTRNIEAWILSRCRHGSLVARFQKLQLCSESEVLDGWRKTWHSHHHDVTQYFAGRPDKLLVFDIDSDSLDKLKAFLPEFKFKPAAFPRKNVTRRAQTSS